MSIGVCSMIFVTTKGLFAYEVFKMEVALAVVASASVSVSVSMIT